MVRILMWDGKTLPTELLDLPAGQYVVESVDEAPALSSEEETGLQAALASLRRGEGIAPEAARRRVTAAIKR
jgi:hypothetical protein